MCVCVYKTLILCAAYIYKIPLNIQYEHFI